MGNWAKTVKLVARLIPVEAGGGQPRKQQEEHSYVSGFTEEESSGSQGTGSTDQ